MNAVDVMTRDVVTVSETTPVREIVALLLSRGITGVPVVDPHGALIGLVSQGDLLRRVELGTEKRRSSWLEFFTWTTTLASDYVRSHGTLAGDVMTTDVICVGPDTALDAIATLMEERRIRRVPVVDGRVLVGIVTRTNLLRALASRTAPSGATASDAEIRIALLAELGRQAWSRRSENSVVVTGGVVHLWGLVTSPAESRALELAAHGIAGVTAVDNHTIVLSDSPYPLYHGSLPA